MRHDSKAAARWMFAAVVGFVVAGRCEAQTREPARQETRSTLKSIDAATRAITVATQVGREAATEKTYTLAKDAEIVVATSRPGLFREIKLADLTPGIQVGLTLNADQATVESVVAEGPMLRGRIKSVDAEKKTLIAAVTAARQMQPDEKTFKIAADAEIAIDDGSGRRLSARTGTLGDLGEGCVVMLRLSLDQKQVVAIMAETPTLQGTVKASDPVKKTVTLVTRTPGRGEVTEEEHSVVLAADGVVLLDDGRGKRLSIKEGKVADIAVGSAIIAKLSMDRTMALLLRVEGPMFVGLLKAVDPEKLTVTLAMPKGRGEEPEEKTLTLAKNALITVDGAVTTLGNFKAGDNGTVVMLRLGLDQKLVQSVTARNAPQR